MEAGKASGPKAREAKRTRKKTGIVDFIFREPGIFLFIPKLSSLYFSPKI